MRRATFKPVTPFVSTVDSTYLKNTLVKKIISYYLSFKTSFYYFLKIIGAVLVLMRREANKVNKGGVV